MTLAIGEFVASLLVAFLFGGVFAVILWGERMRAVADDAERSVLRRENVAYSRGCEATRATMRDDFSLLPRLHCSRSQAGHVRVSDVERMLAEPTDE